jgi:hypothetical protein
MKRILALLALLVLSMAVFALPTVEEVQTQVQKGNYAQAQRMMEEIVAAKPNSAKAHYVYAEMLAHNERFGHAALEAKLARRLDPTLGFTDPEKFAAFERQLEQQQAAAKVKPSPAPAPALRTPAVPVPAPVAVARGSGLTGWVWGLGFGAVAVLVWRLISARRRATRMMGPGMAGPAYGAGPGGYGPAGGPGTGGSGMLGTGLAAAGGFAAGMLAEKMMEDRHPDAASPGAGSGGLVPGMFDEPPAHDTAADDLQRRSIDFGSGDDWGGDDDVRIDGSDDSSGW